MRSTIWVSAVGLSAGAAALAWYAWRRRHPLQPDAGKWQLLGVVKEIALYPVKSCAAVCLESSEVDEHGLSWKTFRDRRLLLFNDEDKVCYADTYPRMLSIRPVLVSESLMCLTAPEAALLTLDIAELLRSGQVTYRQKKGYRLQLVECRPQHHAWFSRAILQRESGMRLFIALDPIIEKRWWGAGSEYELFPVMVLHDKSVADLNSRLSEPNRAHHQQFRGNLLIESHANVKAYDEDEWVWLKIGKDEEKSIILRYNSDCLRCIMVNIDVNTCERNSNFEPLRTLKKYRLRKNPKEPSMGTYFDLHRAGLVKRGDPVFVQY